MLHSASSSRSCFPSSLSYCPSSGSPHSSNSSQPSLFSSSLPSFLSSPPFLAVSSTDRKGVTGIEVCVCVGDGLTDRLTAFYRTHNYHSPSHYLLMMCGLCLAECQTHSSTLPHPPTPDTPDTNLAVTLVSPASPPLPSVPVNRGWTRVTHTGNEQSLTGAKPTERQHSSIKCGDLLKFLLRKNLKNTKKSNK